MRRTREENARLDRLAGSGEGWGGGLPLPLLFAAILNEILDYGPASHERLTEIASTTLAFKTSQVMSTWKSWDEFTRDVLDQMEAQGILTSDGYTWTPGDGLVTDTYLEVIPSRKWKGRKYPSDGVTVWEKEERDRRNRESHAEHEATSLVGNLRPPAPTHVSELRESAARVGHLYPVLVDQHGRILDGAHRKAADPNWEEKLRVVSSEEEALAVSLDANRGSPLSPTVQRRVTELIGELSGTNQIKRDRIESELLRDASQSNHVIAALVGASDPTVGTVRTELLNFSSIHDYRFKGGQGKTTGEHSPRCWCQADAEEAQDAQTDSRPQVLTDELQDQVITAVANGLVTNESDVRKLTGLKVAAAKTALRTARAVVSDRRQRYQPASEPEPVEEPHVHDWGPWVRLRQCADCGEQEVDE